MQNHVAFVTHIQSKQFGMFKNDLIGPLITRPYLILESLAMKKQFFLFQMAKKNPTSEKTGWFLLLG